jgi:hypothetical protein
MFLYLAKLVLEGWIAAGELQHSAPPRICSCDSKFNKWWYYCCSSVAGLIPTQNPTEAMNPDIKGKNKNMTVDS